MKNCNCLHCQWVSAPVFYELDEFYSDWCANGCEPIPGTSKWRFKRHQQTPLPTAPHLPEGHWERLNDSLTESDKALQEEGRIMDAENPLSKQPWVHLASLISPPLKGVKSEKGGMMSIKVYEEKTSFTYCTRNLDTATPPIPNGQRITLQHSDKARRKIMDAANAIRRRYKRQMSFITLTYHISVCQAESKRHIDTFLKRLRRHHNGKEQTFLWVAELQKRGVIHYHLITPFYTDKEWLQSAWREVCGQPTALTNVGGIAKAFNYLAKYVAKSGKPEPIIGRRWACSRNVSQWVKPVHQEQHEMNWERFMEFRDELGAGNFLTEWGWLRMHKKNEINQLLSSQNSCESR